MRTDRSGQLCARAAPALASSARPDANRRRFSTLRAAPAAVTVVRHALTAAGIDRAVAREPREAACDARASRCDLLRYGLGLRWILRPLAFLLPILRSRALAEHGRCHDRNGEHASYSH